MLGCQENYEKVTKNVVQIIKINKINMRDFSRPLVKCGIALPNSGSSEIFNYSFIRVHWT